MTLLKQHLDKLKSSKVSIMQFWISANDVMTILNKYNIAKEVFIKEYAFGIFDYYIDVIQEKVEIGNCPVIFKFLDYLKNKNIGTNELFTICSGFKNALIEFTYIQNINSLEIQKDIVYIYEKNFEGVLKSYYTTINAINKTLNISEKLIDENIIMSSTDLQGIITSVSTAFCDISGYTKEELIGYPHNIVRHPDMPKEAFEDLWKTIQADKTWHGEIKNTRKDGGIYWVEATVDSLYSSDGTKIGYSAIRHDITYKKEAQLQQDIIVEQSKSAAMGEMISMIAHQWRQPLQAIAILIQKLPLEKIIDGEISDETLEDVVSSIEEQLSQMSKTIEEFRSFFNPNKDKNRIFAAALLEQARELMAYQFKVDEIELHLIYDEDIEINIHTHEILQVFINILNNAREVLVEKCNQNRKIDIKFYKYHNNIVFEISDNGGGIPSIIMNKIFEPYFSTKKNKNGTGLGLYMSKTIIEKNASGMLSVTNTTEGAMFKITLPIE